jgi:flagellar hook-length control protein FliK
LSGGENPLAARFGGLLSLLLAEPGALLETALPDVDPSGLSNASGNAGGAGELAFPALAIHLAPEELRALLRAASKREAQGRAEETAAAASSENPFFSGMIPAFALAAALPEEDAAAVASGTDNKSGTLWPAAGKAASATGEELSSAKFAVSFALEAAQEEAVETAAPKDSTGPDVAPNASPGAPGRLGGAAPASADGVRTPVYDPQWKDALGEKIVWMARNDQQQASLRLHPAHLGPLQIQLHLEADKASASFLATTPEVRQAIEEALPRLREMLASAGITLGETQVGEQSRQENGFGEAFLQGESRHNDLSGGNTQAGDSRNDADDAILEDISAVAGHLRRGSGLVDLFA